MGALVLERIGEDDVGARHVREPRWFNTLSNLVLQVSKLFAAGDHVEVVADGDLPRRLLPELKRHEVARDAVALHLNFLTGIGAARSGQRPKLNQSQCCFPHRL